MGWFRKTNNKTGEIVEHVVNGIDITAEAAIIYDNARKYDSQGELESRGLEEIDNEATLRVNALFAELKKLKNAPIK